MADYDRNNSDRDYGDRGYGDRGYGSRGYGDRGLDRNRGSEGSYLDRAYSGNGRYERGRYEGDRYDNMDEHRRVAIDETSRLIASDKVEGTRVYSRRGDRLGTVRNVMIDKRSGRVEYAVMDFGGFLGIGKRHHPLPWAVLRYDEDRYGYVVDMDERELERAPSYRTGEEPDWDRGYGEHVHGYYGTRY